MSDIELLEININDLENIINSLIKYKGEITNECGTLNHIKNVAPTFWNQGEAEDIRSYCENLNTDVTKLNNLVNYLDKYISTLRILIEEIRQAIQRSISESEG